MADESTLTSHNDVYLAAQITASILEEIRPRNVMRRLMDEKVAVGSNVYQWPIQDDPGAATAKTEATDRVNTALTTSSAQATLATVGQMASPTDELGAASLVPVIPLVREVVGRSVLEKFEVDMCALLDDTTQTVATSGVDMTADTFLLALATLVSADIPGMYVFVGDPVSTTDLQRDIAASTSAIYGNPRWNPDMINGSDNGFQFTFAGVDVYQSSAVTTANGGADQANGMFVPNHTFGLAVAPGWPIPRIELQRDASNNLTEVVATGRYGGVLKRNGDAVEVQTDA